MRALRGIVGSRPSATPEPRLRPSTSAIFPGLHKLDLPMDQSHDSPLLTLNLSAPSFLDAVVKDEFSDSPLYIIETHRDRTGIYRCETENISNVAKVQWPSRSKMISANAVALSGISIQIHGGKWRPAEEFLKFGSLFTSRKFQIPHHPQSLKWKRVGGFYSCTCSSIKGPLAILQAAHLSAPPRLRVFSSLLREDDTIRNQPNYGGVPHVVLDYLVATSLLLVTDMEEYMHRPQQDVGAARLAMEAFLPPSLRNRSNGRGSYASSDSRSPGDSNENVSSMINNSTDDARSVNSEVPSTPSSTISQCHPYSFYHLAVLDPDVPPVPEVPPEHQASVPPIPPRSSTLPAAPSLGRTPTVRRRLPQPPAHATPITPARTEQLWSFPGAYSTPDLTLYAHSPDSSLGPPPLPTPPHHTRYQHSRQTSEVSRSSMPINRRHLPPQRQPPQLPIPIPPKLRDDMARPISPTVIPSDGMLSSTSETSGRGEEPGSSIHEGGGAGSVGGGSPQDFHRRFSEPDNHATMRASVYELPPPAYDAIDFSLPRPPVLGVGGYRPFSVESRPPPEQIS